MAAFADRLWRLKVEAGDPPFAEMSSRLGAAASKSSLAAAAQGRRLPSWETTWEFVRVLAVGRLGRDPEETEREWREHWRRAKVLSELPDAEPSVADVGEAAGPPDIRSAPSTEPDAVIVPRRVVQARPLPRRRRLNAVVLSAVVAFAMLGVIIAGTAFFKETPAKAPKPSPSLQVDDSIFEGDITYPDGTLVEKGESFEKVWRLRNTGTVEWKDRFLMRVNEDICHAPERVEIPRTPPGQTVDIRVPVRALKRSGTCRLYWKMVDPQGRTLLPAKRPIFLDVRVE
ncbi:hypothetical protein GCM10010439_09820 [Actinocorallia aurantiaca]|uniref:Nbr1 FW domain-containing protein n=1 Tax=Actinocorallia aurantiaca TaxID=46204 RepID=A0ABN3TY59_9ACTN